MKLERENLCDAYLRDAEQDQAYYELFFHFCRKFHVDWSTATEMEKSFISEVTRVTYECKRAQQTGMPIDTVRPAFSA